MRDMEQKGLLVGDFICVYGDVLSNVPVETALAAHRARRTKDKNAIMTMVLREAGDYHRTKSQSARSVFVIDAGKDRCLHYEQLRPGQQHPRLNIDSEILSGHTEIDVRSDLIDCGIDICTPDALALWSDNFDWQRPRRGFLYGTLKDYELNQKTIHTHVVSDSYAARVKSLQAYDAVSKDVLCRWTYPLTPDTNLVPDQSYQLLKGNTYREEGVVLARSSQIKRNTVLGKATSVGEGSVISNSIVGRRCVIGKRVKINGAYIWDDARIGDDTTIERAVVGNEASVGRRCIVQPGALLSYGVHIADGTTVQSDSRIGRFKRKRRTSQGEPIRAPPDPKAVGKGGDGHQLDPDEDEDEETEGLVGNKHDWEGTDAESISTLASEDEDEDSDYPANQPSSRTGSFGSIASDESGESRHKAADFQHEAASSIFDSLQKGEEADNIQLELKALTLSSNADGKQVRRAVAVALMKRVANLVESGNTPQKAVSQIITSYKLLVQRAVLDLDKEVKEEQVEFLLYMQTDLVHRPQGDKILLYACNAMVSSKVIELEGVEQWLEDERSSASEELRTVKQETEEVMGGDSSEDEEESEEDE